MPTSQHIHRYSHLLLAAMMMLCLASCFKASKIIEVELNATTDEGVPIDKAEVFINQERKRLTNSMGKARFKLDAKIDTDIKFEIRKESADRYYAPHFDTIKITKSSKPTLKINAVLYSVPKPKPYDSSLKNQKKIAEKPLEKVSPDGPGLNPQIDTNQIDENIKNLLPDDELPNEKISVDVEAKMSAITPKKNKTPLPKPPKKSTPTDTREKNNSRISLSALPLGKLEKKESEDSQKPKETKNQSTTNSVSIYVYSASQPLEDVSVYVGHEGEGSLTLVCRTDQRGWCNYAIASKTQKISTFVARKKGYQTVEKKIAPSPGDRLNLVMPKGETIDIFAVMKRYGQSSGLGDIKVYINQKYVGNTDNFGRFSYVYQGPPGDLVEVSLETDDYLPKKYSTDYVVSGPLSLVRYYSPVIPQPILVAKIPVQAAGKLKEETLSRFADGTQVILKKSMDQYLFSKPAFSEAPADILTTISDTDQRSMLDIVKAGWINSPSKANLDAVIVPTLILKKPLRIELALIDSSGRTLTAAQERLSNLEDHNAISFAVKSLAKKLTDRFPFEGSIVEKSNNNVWINIGRKHGLGINAGDELDIHGPQKDRFGRSISHNQIGKLRIIEVKRDKSQGVITETAPRSSIDVGDQVILRSQNLVDDQVMSIEVIDKKSAKSISQANIYFDNKWLGSTDQNGKLKVSFGNLNKRGNLQIIKPGYQAFSRNTNLASTQNLKINIERETSFIRIDSKPSNAKVFIDGKFIGTTPIQKPVSVPSGFVKLTASGSPEYKIYSNIIELGNGTLDLTGDRSINLEKDLLGNARAILDNGDIEKAITNLSNIPKDHSDFLAAQHQLGELYLGILNQPAQAAAAFGNVTSIPEISGFNDKRFISAHINEGIALFKTGETLKESEKEAAIAHYQKAFETLQRVEPQLRHINEKDQALAVHNTFYYRALAAHRNWELTNDEILLNIAHGQWIKYLEGAAKTYPLEKLDSLVRTAEVYKKQIDSIIRTAKSEIVEDSL